MKKTKKPEKKISSHHPEAKGLCLLAFSTVLFLSLFSFVQESIQENWLGMIGYFSAWVFHYVLGFGSFFLSLFLFWAGFNLLVRGRVPAFKRKTFYFSLFLISTCFLLNLYAETKPLIASFLKDRSISESITIHSHLFSRNNLGGVPFYYLFRDMPTFNLQELFSNVGVFLTFSMIGLVSAILLLEIRVMMVLKTLFLILRGIGKILLKLCALIKAIFPKAYKEEFSPAEILGSIEGFSSSKKTEEPLEFDSLPLEEEIYPQPRKKRRNFSFEEEEEWPPKKSRKRYPKLLRSRENIQNYDGDYKHYQRPPLSLLTTAKRVDQPSLKKDLKRQAEVLEETLFSFGIDAKVGEINCGPTITSFEVHPAIGVKVQKIKALENDIALNLQAKSIRIIAPIPGKAAVGVEIPSLYPQEVGFKETLMHYQKKHRPLSIPILLGKTVSGEEVMCDLTKMPHCIIAGATGAGKSVCINTIIMSILMNARPDEIKLLMIDPKKVELTPYTPLPHMIAPVITEPHGAYAALNWVVKEMQNRYEILKQLGLRNITAFNSRKEDKELEESSNLEIPKRLPWIVMIIDEFADLMLTSSTDLETPIARIAQMARAVGIHLILATQRPSREVITGLIKANFPTRIAFKVSSRINSQIILDENGAESLLGNGDMLFLPPGTSQLLRAQGVYIRDEDINQVINFICSEASANYLVKSFDLMSHDDLFPQENEAPRDTLYSKALSIVVESKNASTTFLQRKLKVGYARAASLMDELEDRGVIGPQDGSKARKVLITPMQARKQYENQDLF